MKLRNPALALDLECIGIGPDVNDKPAALQPWTARIVCASMMLHDKKKLWLYDSTLVDADKAEGVASFGFKGEAALVTEISQTLDRKLGDQRGCLVTFNGRGYDLPVIIAAMTRHGLKPNAHAMRYMHAKRWEQDPHFDLCEILSYAGATTKPSLRAVCVGLGLADPKAEADGCKVAEWVAARDGNSLRTYNVGDVLACGAIVDKMGHWFE